jgi:hypothetical protein
MGTRHLGGRQGQHETRVSPPLPASTRGTRKVFLLCPQHWPLLGEWGPREDTGCAPRWEQEKATEHPGSSTLEKPVPALDLSSSPGQHDAVGVRSELGGKRGTSGWGQKDAVPSELRTGEAGKTPPGLSLPTSRVWELALEGLFRVLFLAPMSGW